MVEPNNIVEMDLDLGLYVDLNMRTLRECMCLAGSIYKYREKVNTGTKLKLLNVDDILSCDIDGEVVLSGTNSRDIEYGVVAEHSRRRIYVVFRGSESLTDWYHDLIVSKVCLDEVSNVKVHKGGYLQLNEDGVYTDIKNVILELLSDPKYKDYQVYVTGHSLGGMLATLFTYILAKQESNMNLVCISFASPRVGNKGFRRDFDSLDNVTHFRCFNTRDVVTYVPNFRYYHVGFRVKLYKDAIKVLAPFSDTKGASFWRWWSVGEHKCEEYCRRLRDISID